jgi:hypothetical protein
MNNSLNGDTASYYFDGYVEATLDPGWSLIIGSFVRVNNKNKQNKNIICAMMLWFINRCYRVDYLFCHMQSN